MPFDGSGNYSPPGPPTFPAVSGQPISSAYFNALINDIANNGLSKCLTVDGQSTITAPIPFNGQDITGVDTLFADEFNITSDSVIGGSINSGYRLTLNHATDTREALSVAGTITGLLQTTPAVFNLGAVGASALTLSTNGTVRGTFEAGGTFVTTANASFGPNQFDGSGYGRGVAVSGAAGAAGVFWHQPINTNDQRVSILNNLVNNGVGTFEYIGSSQSATNFESGGGQFRWYNAPPGTAGNTATQTLRMQLDSSGLLVIDRTYFSDTSFHAFVNSAVPTVLVDTNDFWSFNRGTNLFGYTIGGASIFTIGAAQLTSAVGLTISAGGITVSSGGAVITGASSVTGTLNVTSTLSRGGNAVWDAGNLPITAWAQTFLGRATAILGANDLGAIRLTNFSVSAGTFSFTFTNGTNTIILQGGTGSIGANVDTTISFPTAFVGGASCVVSGGSTGGGGAGDVHTRAATGLTTQAISNTAGVTVTYTWIAIGGG